MPGAASLHPLNPRLTAQRGPKWKPTYDCNNCWNSAGSERPGCARCLNSGDNGGGRRCSCPCCHGSPRTQYCWINTTFRIAFRPLLMYAGRARSGFTPALRDQVFKRFRGWKPNVPFANLPEGKGGRWARGCVAREDEGMSVAQASTHRRVSVCRNGHLTATCWGFPPVGSACMKAFNAGKWRGTQDSDDKLSVLPHTHCRFVHAPKFRFGLMKSLAPLFPQLYANLHEFLDNDRSRGEYANTRTHCARLCTPSFPRRT